MLVCSLLRFFGPLLFPAVLFVNIAEAAVSNAPPEAGYYGSAGGGVKLGGQPDAAVQPNAGLVAGKSPLAPRGDARFVGIWTNSDKNFFLAMLGDGRAVILDKRPGSIIHLKSGVYRVENLVAKFEWLISGRQNFYFSVDQFNLALSNASSSITSYLHRQGTAADAVGYYGKRYQEMMAQAKKFKPYVPTASPVRQATDIIGFIPDPNPYDIFTRSTVYAKNGIYQWTDPTDRHPHYPDEPGFDAQKFVFLPNGRFAYEGWIYEIIIDPGIWGDPLYEPWRIGYVKHYQYWGKYRVIAGTGDVVKGETVELVYEDGSRRTAHVVHGRAYLRLTDSIFGFENTKHIPPRAAGP